MPQDQVVVSQPDMPDRPTHGASASSFGRTLWNQRIVTRDGTELAADVILPNGAGPWPAVVMRTPYMRGQILRQRPSWVRLVGQDYAFVTVDVRGRGDSDGEFRPFQEDGPDGYDAVEWVATQAWCTGRVGMVGLSYEALTQWWTAKARPPHLSCIAPMAVGVAQMGNGRSCGTGVPMQYWLWWLHLVTGRTMQHPGAPSWEEHWSHLPLQDLATAIGTSRKWWPAYVRGEIDYLGPGFAFSAADWASFDVPTLVGVGWWDDQTTMANWEALSQSPAAPASRLLIGAWDHDGNECPRPTLGDLDVAASAIDTMAYVERFLAVHLKGNTELAETFPRCRIFRTGLMSWEDHDQWPAPDARETSWYLGGAGSLTHEVIGVSSSDTYTYDPTLPVRDLSSLDRYAGTEVPLDVRYLLRRDDVIYFRTERLDRPVHVSGRGFFECFVSVDCPDTDLCAWVLDIHDDGRAIQLGALVAPPPIVRLSFEGEEPVEPLGPLPLDGPRRLVVPLVWMHHTYLAGHRIALAISSSLYPVFAPNLNSGEPWHTTERRETARVTIHHGSQSPSRLILPVEPARASE